MKAAQHAEKIAALQNVAAAALNDLSEAIAAAGLALNSPLQIVLAAFTTKADGLAVKFEPKPITAAEIQDEADRRALQAEAEDSGPIEVPRTEARFIDISAKSRPERLDKKITPGTAPQGINVPISV